MNLLIVLAFLCWSVHSITRKQVPPTNPWAPGWSTAMAPSAQAMQMTMRDVQTMAWKGFTKWGNVHIRADCGDIIIYQISPACENIIILQHQLMAQNAAQHIPDRFSGLNWLKSFGQASLIPWRIRQTCTAATSNFPLHSSNFCGAWLKLDLARAWRCLNQNLVFQCLMLH